ncbi:MAG: BREX-3 system phosphatase PglZ [Breznakiellaceae bacterium]
MKSWRDVILKEFTPQVAKLTLVADPDGLLLEEGILEDIQRRGFALIPFEDPIAFRYAYESKFRSHWDLGETTNLVVILRSQESDLHHLPYDLLQAGRKLSFSLGTIFPHLSYPVVASLDRGYFDVLFAAQELHAPGQLGDNATKDFILRHVFEIAPELIKQPSELLRVLLRRHYYQQKIPAEIEQRLILLLRQNQVFKDWPLDIIVPDREAFLAFLQERWSFFINRVAMRESASVLEKEPHYKVAIQGPMELPFEHDDIRGYIEKLFAEGMLQAIPKAEVGISGNNWWYIGIKTGCPEQRTRRLEKLIDSLEATLPEEKAPYSAWFSFAHAWAEFQVLRHETLSLPVGLQNRIQELIQQVDTRFEQWIQRRYAALHQLPPDPPVMVHHIPRFLSKQTAKIALVVIDGLALDQWVILRNELVAKVPTLRFREQAVFAWIPTLTAVSRQALFAGKAPLFFPDSIQNTHKEPALWTRFWEEQGLTDNQVLYLKGVGDGDSATIGEVLSHPKVQVAALVVDKIDKIMHGMELGTAGMHSQTRLWACQPYLLSLLDALLNMGFQVYLTSDHGNVEAKGMGRPAEGTMADQRGERVRIYPDAILRRKVKELFPEAIEWEPIGLPDDYYPLLAPARRAFIQEQECTVSHGGFSIEEIIVPLIKIEGSTK